jgi:hypothetical protein
MDDRRDDWQHGVDENLASLNAGQRVWEREMEVVRKLLGEFDRILRGDLDKDTDGLISRMHLQENEVNLLKAVVLKDKAGNRGLVSRVESLESDERKSEIHLKVWMAVIGLLSASIVSTISNLDRIEAFLNRGKKDPVDQMIERAKHPHRRHIIVHEIPADGEDAD